MKFETNGGVVYLHQILGVNEINPNFLYKLF